MEEKATVDVALYDLRVSDRPDDFYAKVRTKGRLNNQAIAERIIKEGADYQLEVLVEILNKADRIKAQALATGYNVNTLFINASLNVNGTFYQSAFDPSLHQLHACVLPAYLTRKLIKNTRVKMSGHTQTGIVIMSITDFITGAVNSIITPGNAIVLRGERLKIEATKENKRNAGVFFINTKSNERTKVSQPISNKNKELIIMVPELLPGDYYLEISTQYSGSKMLKNLRREIYGTALTVN